MLHFYRATKVGVSAHDNSFFAVFLFVIFYVFEFYLFAAFFLTVDQSFDTVPFLVILDSICAPDISTLQLAWSGSCQLPFSLFFR